MDLNRLNTNVQNYTGTVKDKLLVINGKTVENKDKVTELQEEIEILKNYIGTPDDSTDSNTIYGFINKFMSMLEDNEKVVAESLVDFNARLDAINA